MMVQKITAISDRSQIAYYSNSGISFAIACCKVPLKRLVESLGSLNTDANMRKIQSRAIYFPWNISGLNIARCLLFGSLAFTSVH